MSSYNSPSSLRYDLNSNFISPNINQTLKRNNSTIDNYKDNLRASYNKYENLKEEYLSNMPFLNKRIDKLGKEINLLRDNFDYKGFHKPTKYLNNSLNSSPVVRKPNYGYEQINVPIQNEYNIAYSNPIKLPVITLI